MSEELLDQIAALASRSSSTVYVVGGYLRDRLLGREPLDLDLLVEGSIAPFLDALSEKAGFEPVVFSRHEPITYRVAMDDWLIDVSACRRGGLDDALRRRDFTINAMASPLAGPHGAGGGELGKPIDPLGGLDDLKARRIRHITPRGLQEDPVRLLRAIRLAAVLDGFSLDPVLVSELERKAPLLESAPVERVMAEMEVILASPRAGMALRLMARSGLLFRVIPELASLQGLAQNAWHRYDAFEHTLRCVENADSLQDGEAAIGIDEPLGVEDAEILKWAAVLHDTGKAATALTDAEGVVHFYGHEAVSAEIATAALARLRASARKSARVHALVAAHLRLTLLCASESVSDRALRRLVHEVKHDTPLLCLLALADRLAGGGPDFERRYGQLQQLAARVLGVLRGEGEAVISPAPLLSGHEVMEILALPPGPRVGAVLRWLTKMQVEEKLSRHDDAVRLLQSLPPSKVLTLEDEV